MPISRINVLQYGKLGALMIKWAQEPDSRPKTLAEFVTMTQGIVEHPMPDRVKGLQFVQSNLEVLLIRLPAAEMVKESMDRVSTATGKYPLPAFYEEYFVGGEHTNQKEMLELRVGDYTMAQCQ